MSRSVLCPRVQLLKTLIEPVFAEMYIRYCMQKQKSVSESLRGMIIEELRSTGLLTDEMLSEMVSGYTPPERRPVKETAA